MAYSYNFQGISQQLDYLLVSSTLLALQPEFDLVHVNTEFPNQASDHDPILARLLLYDRIDLGTPPSTPPHIARAALTASG